MAANKLAFAAKAGASTATSTPTDGEDFDIVRHGSFPDLVAAVAVAEKIYKATGNPTQIDRGDVVVWD